MRLYTSFVRGIFGGSFTSKCTWSSSPSISTGSTSKSAHTLANRLRMSSRTFSENTRQRYWPQRPKSHGSARRVSLQQLKILSAIKNCRTATLGGHARTARTAPIPRLLKTHALCANSVVGSWRVQAAGILPPIQKQKWSKPPASATRFDKLAATPYPPSNQMRFARRDTALHQSLAHLHADRLDRVSEGLDCNVVIT